MKIKIDRRAASRAVFITSTPEFGDLRRYYEIGAALIVTRNDLDLHQLAGHVVDAAVGWEPRVRGFTLDENQIGQLRTKVTIYRTLRGRRYDQTLSDTIGHVG